VSPSELLQENESLKKQLAESKAALVDRDAQIKKLASDLAAVQAVVKQLLAARGGGYRVPEGQGLLFSETPTASESLKVEVPAPDEITARAGKRVRRASRARSTLPGCPARIVCTTCLTHSASIR
jgi:hypothetical protein